MDVHGLSCSKGDSHYSSCAMCSIRHRPSEASSCMLPAQGVEDQYELGQLVVFCTRLVKAVG